MAHPEERHAIRRDNRYRAGGTFATVVLVVLAGMLSVGCQGLSSQRSQNDSSGTGPALADRSAAQNRPASGGYQPRQPTEQELFHRGLQNTLVSAAGGGNLDDVRTVLAEGADVNGGNNDDDTAIKAALRW